MSDQHGRIELNAATEAEIASLPSMNGRLARRVVRYRHRHGPFRHLADLEHVRGMSAIPQETIAELAYVDSSVRVNGESVGFGRGEDIPETIALYGSPDLLHGRIAVVNEGKAPIHSVTIDVHGFAVRDTFGKTLRKIRLNTRLEPGERSFQDFSITLDSATPPGAHRGEFVIGSHRRAAILNVTEMVRTSVAPQQLVMRDVPGARIEKTVFVSNIGNMPIREGSTPSFIVAEQGNLVCRVARNSVRRLSNPTWDKLVGAVSDELKEACDEIDPIRVRIKSKPDVIAPGDTGTLILELQLPKSLRRGQSYVGLCRVFDTAIRIFIDPIVGPAADGDSDTLPPQDQRATRRQR